MILPLEKKINKLKSGLYIVSTPIGNLGDITYRAIEVLKQSEFILCEDTRVSQNLLNKYGIKSKLISNHKFNEKKNLSKIIKILISDSVVSLISDAGTPTISDPGGILVNECVKNKINIFPIPGASAVTAAISIAGFSEKYYFYGFFPEKQKIINEDLEMLQNLNCSIVFFVSPNKINKMIPIIKNYFFDRAIVVCREISKYYEEYTRIQVSQLKSYEKLPKGELTIVISEKNGAKKTSLNLDESDKKKIKKMIKILSVKDITELISNGRNIPKKLIYHYCLELKNEN